jgi:hypothetical protein
MMSCTAAIPPLAKGSDRPGNQYFATQRDGGLSWPGFPVRVNVYRVTDKMNGEAAPVTSRMQVSAAAPTAAKPAGNVCHS